MLFSILSPALPAKFAAPAVRREPLAAPKRHHRNLVDCHQSLDITNLPTAIQPPSY